MPFSRKTNRAILICGFALTASAFGIASVLFVSVVQKSKQIGILKSMGARDSQILLVFTLEGLGIALVGSVVGVAMALVILRVLENVPQAVRVGKEDKLFNIIYDPAIFAQACFAAIIATLLAALLPAYRASRMNPVEVIRAHKGRGMRDEGKPLPCPFSRRSRSVFLIPRPHPSSLPSPIVQTIALKKLTASAGRTRWRFCTA
jgi:predicted lysophospholipase L1 biosynthesis ABC-type transport system permease subunit